MTAALLAAAILTPDSPDLPAEVTFYRDAEYRLWVETSEEPGVLRFVYPDGAVMPLAWTWAQCWYSFGPLDEVPHA